MEDYSVNFIEYNRIEFIVTVSNSYIVGGPLVAAHREILQK